jgi:hypothetical protein
VCATCQAFCFRLLPPFGQDLTLYKFRMDTKEGRTMSLDREFAKSGSGFLAVYELSTPETSVN